MNELQKEKLKQELQELVKDWCKMYNRTYDEAINIIKTLYTPRKE